MSNLFARVTAPANFAALLVAGLLALTVSGASQAAADATDGLRSSVSRHTATGGRENPVASSSESTDEYDALATSGSRSKSNTRSGSAKLGAGSNTAQSASFDF